jgi:hypothetical protein
MVQHLTDFVEHVVRSARVGTDELRLDFAPPFGGKVQLDGGTDKSRSTPFLRFGIPVDTHEEVRVDGNLYGFCGHVGNIQQDLCGVNAGDAAGILLLEAR